MNIPTAESFYDKKDKNGQPMSFNEKMIEFAKLHVTEALKQASQEVKTKEDYFSDEDTSLSLIKEMIEDGGAGRYDIYGDAYAVTVSSIDKDSILNAYSLELIK